MKKYFVILYNGKMDLEILKDKIVSNKWQVPNIPELYKPQILSWLNASYDEIVKTGWPPNPNIYNSIKQLSEQ